MTPADIAALQKRLRLNRAQFARVLDVSVSRLNDYMGKRKAPDPLGINTPPWMPAYMTDRLETLARYAEVGAI